MVHKKILNRKRSMAFDFSSSTPFSLLGFHAVMMFCASTVWILSISSQNGFCDDFLSNDSRESSASFRDSTSATGGVKPGERAVVQMHCAVLPLERLEVSSQRDGRIHSIYGRPGTMIRAEQVVVQMESDEQSIRRALAEGELKKAESLRGDRSALEAAQALLSKAEATYDMTMKLNQKSELELFRLKMDVTEKKANLRLAEARSMQDAIDFDIKEQQLALARWEEQRCAITSPVSGIISEQFKYPGEFVRQGETILRVIHMERVAIRVEFDSRVIPTYELTHRIGTAIFPSGESGGFEITDLRFESILPSNLDNRHYHAIAIVQNPSRTDAHGREHWLLRAGMVGRLTLSTGPASSGATTERGQ